MTNTEILQKIKDNDIEIKLSLLKSVLEKNTRLKHFSFSAPDFSFLQDPTIWVSGFMKGIQAQVKMQLTGNTVIVNLRPEKYDYKSKEIFIGLMTKLNYDVKNINGRIYAPTADSSIKQDFPKGFDRNDTEQIVTHLVEIINKIIAVK